MEKDKFDDKIVYLEHKVFEAGIMISGIVIELLETFPEMRIEIEVQLPFNDYEKGYITIDVEAVFFDTETELITINCRNMKEAVLWDDLDFSSRMIIMHEIHHKYKSEVMFKKFSSSDTPEKDIH
jgi:hypothetical protein